MPEFIKVATVDEIEEGGMKIFDVRGNTVVLANVKGGFYAFNGECPHKGGPLGEGALNENVLTCPWHLLQFDVITGKIVHEGFKWDRKDMQTYEIKVEGNDILVKV